MSARSFIIQLQPGIGQALLPDHRKMLPGIQYVVDAETFSKISLGARQNVITVVSVNGDSTTTGSFVPAQSSSGVNLMAAGSGQNFFNYLTLTGPNLSTVSLAGFAAQGFDAGGTAGTGGGIGLPQATLSGSAANQTITGPDGARYTLAYNGTASTISGGWATVLYYENNRYISTASGITYQVRVDGQNTPYVISANTTITGVNGAVTTVGTKQGAFAGVVISTSGIASGSFGWLQITGVCPSVVVASGTAAGSTVAVASGSNAGLTQVPSNTTTSVSSAGIVTGSALANNVIGTTQTAAVSGTNGQYYAVVELRSRRVKQPYVRFLNKN